MLLFGILMDIISMSSEAGNVGYERFSVYGMFSILYKVFQLTLGEFSLEDYETGHPWVWLNKIIFVGATFIINITILNVLIAIMMETFNKINANQKIFSNKMKIRFICESEDSLLPKRLKFKKDSSFKLFIAEPQYEMEFENDKVVIKVDRMEKTSQKIEGMLKNYSVQFDTVKDEIASMKKSMKSMKQNLKN